MRTTIDKAGRLVVPKQLRDRLGLHPGAVDVVIDGASLRVEPVAHGEVAEEHGRLIIAPAGTVLDDEAVRALRDADQR
jgi:AbrB family looped-hinge helix DNA binding protein